MPGSRAQQRARRQFPFALKRPIHLAQVASRSAPVRRGIGNVVGESRSAPRAAPHHVLRGLAGRPSPAAGLLHGGRIAGAIRLGGPFLDEGGEMAGSLILMEAADLEAARAFNAADPYTLAGLFESVDIRPWKATFGALP